MKQKSAGLFQKILFALLLSSLVAIGLFCLLAYFLQGIPKYQLYVAYFPWVYAVCFGILIVLVCLPFRFDSPWYPILIGAFFAFTSAVWALLFMTDHISFGSFFGTRVLFLLSDVISYWLALRRKGEKRRKMKKTRFSK